MKYNKNHSTHIVIILLLTTLLVFTNCGGGDVNLTGNYEVTISWAANGESVVNSPGGGYEVYYSKTPGFSLSDPGISVIDLPYTSGPLAPVSTTLTLKNGTWYIKVIAYSGQYGDLISEPSTETSITLP